MTETEKQAREIYEEYDVPFPKPWAGLKFIWHPWHQPASRLYWLMTFEEFCKRAVEIGRQKPEHERLERLMLMRPVKKQLAIPKYYAKAREAYAKAWEAYAKAHKKQILAIHAAECPNCKWDGGKLPQFD